MLSHDYKVIFIHIPKCAGRSICHALNQEFDHYTASYYQTQHAGYWNEYTVFTVVRNPYHRLVSMYHYIKNNDKHANEVITNFGKMLPFKTWLTENITSFAGEFAYPSIDGNREGDGDIGSTFWFSSQVSRISVPPQPVGAKVHILRYEDGLQAVGKFLQEKTNVHINIPHLNSSYGHSQNNYLKYYDQDLLNTVNNFPPFVKDCNMLNYQMIHDINDENA